jgi:formylglycine-generating enzyme required for sulfatase activity
LNDMAGNAAEWVEDCWNESYKGAPSNGSPWESGQ